jgi:hypothetical protein
MKDTFSKLHHNFSLVSSDEDEEESKQDKEERSKRRDIGLKMLMSRDSSFGVVGFKGHAS